MIDLMVSEMDKNNIFFSGVFFLLIRDGFLKFGTLPLVHPELSFGFD